MPKNKIRGFIGVKSNDGHDAAILIVADILKKGGIEVILGGYDLTIDKFVQTIVQEGVHFAGISSYNGAHIPFFQGVRNALQKRNYPHIHLIGGGGATITPADIETLEQIDGVDKIFKAGEAPLAVPYINEHYDFSVVPENPEDLVDDVREGDPLSISRWMNMAEEKARLESLLDQKKAALDVTAVEKSNRPFLDEPLEKEGMTVVEVLERLKRFSSCLSMLDGPAAASDTTV
ncbi:MAG: cobalamin B12-binding domain-containing protein, partial [Nitrospinales bacterium]